MCVKRRTDGLSSVYLPAFKARGCFVGVREAYPSPLPSLLLLLPWPLSGHCCCDCRPESSGVLEEDLLTLSLSPPSPSLLKNRREKAELHISSDRDQISPGRTPREEESWHKRCVKTRVKRTFKNNSGPPAFASHNLFLSSSPRWICFRSLRGSSTPKLEWTLLAGV